MLCVVTGDDDLKISNFPSMSGRDAAPPNANLSKKLNVLCQYCSTGVLSPGVVPMYLIIGTVARSVADSLAANVLGNVDELMTVGVEVHLVAGIGA